MRAWINSIRDLARKISDLGGSVSDDELVVLTNNLPDPYQPLIVSLELVGEKTLTVDYVVNRLINEEDRQGKEGNALSARNAKPLKSPRSQITRWKCKKKGHYSYECQDEHEADAKNPLNRHQRCSGARAPLARPFRSEIFSHIFLVVARRSGRSKKAATHRY